MLTIAGPVAAQGVNLEGVWQYSRVNLRSENYSGNIVIDARRMASDVTKRPIGPDVAQSGHVTVNGNQVEIVFDKAVPGGPPGYSPDHFYCTIKSEREMTCSNVDFAGSKGYGFPLVRVGATRR